MSNIYSQMVTSYQNTGRVDSARKVPGETGTACRRRHGGQNKALVLVLKCSGVEVATLRASASEIAYNTPTPTPNGQSPTAYSYFNALTGFANAVLTDLIPIVNIAITAQRSPELNITIGLTSIL